MTCRLASDATFALCMRLTYQPETKERSFGTRRWASDSQTKSAAKHLFGQLLKDNVHEVKNMILNVIIGNAELVTI